MGLPARRPGPAFGTTVFLTTHYLEEAEAADAVCVLARGRIIERGTPGRGQGAPVEPDAGGRLPAVARAGQVTGRVMSVQPGSLPVLRGPSHQLSGLLVIAQRDVIKLLRDRPRLAVNLAFPVLLIGGLGNILQPTVGQVTGLNAVTLAFTGVLAASLFQSAAAGMISIVEDRENDFSRELFVTPVSRLTLVAGKVAGETLVALCQGVFITVFAVAFGVRMSAGTAGDADRARPGLLPARRRVRARHDRGAAQPALGDADLPVPDHPAVRARRRPGSAVAGIRPTSTSLARRCRCAMRSS